MAIVPLIKFLVAMFIEDSFQAALIGGIVATIINLILMIIAVQVQKTEDEGDTEDVSCFSKKGFIFLFPAKSGYFEILVCAIVTFLYTALGIRGFFDEKEVGINAMIYFLLALNSYSLFSKNCPESAVYRDNDSEFQIGSNHYQRPLYWVICAIILEIMVESFEF